MYPQLVPKSKQETAKNVTEMHLKPLASLCSEIMQNYAQHTLHRNSFLILIRKKYTHKKKKKHITFIIQFPRYGTNDVMEKTTND